MRTSAAPDLALPSSPGEEGARGVYVHVPFCLVHCPYCDFNAHAGLDSLKPAYVEALLREVRAAADGGRVSSVFFGGGTPTELPPEDLGRVLGALRDSFALDPDAEVSVEANPESAGERVLGALLGAGFTRVSVGVQSLAPHVLRRLGRAHGAEQGLAALRAARAVGFPHVSADLMFGTAGESGEEWRRSLEGVLETEPDHVSTYALTVEEGTPLAARVARGRAAAPDDDDQADKYAVAEGVLVAAGFVRYEVSNWARPGSWSRHNVGYWSAGDYLGIGAGAHAHRGGRRSWNVRSPRAYVERSPHAEEGHEVLPAGERIREAGMLGLRMAGGIARAPFAARFGADPVRAWPEEMEDLRELGLVGWDAERLAPTPRGFFLWGHVARTLLAT